MSFNSKVLLSLTIVLQFILINELFAFFIWLIFLVLGEFISNLISKSVISQSYFFIFYFIFSFIGLIICLDNYNNFNELIGFAGDDKRFFETVLYLTGDGNKPEFETSIYTFFLVPIAEITNIVKVYSLADLLPINWFFSGLIAVLINEISYHVIRKDIPLKIFFITYPLCFIIADSFTRLYRDVVIFFFVLLAIKTIFSRGIMNFKFPTNLVFVSLLRFANVIIPIVFLLAKKLNTKKIRTIYLIIGVITFLTITYLPNVLKLSMIYGSDMSRSSRYESAFSKIDQDEVLNLRFQENQSTSNALMAKAYSEVSVQSIALRAAFGYFYPLRFKSPVNTLNHSQKGEIKGFYLYNIIQWGYTICMLIVFPLLIIGIVFNRNDHLIPLILTQIIFFILVLLISGQTRHLIGAFIFNPIVVFNGYLIIQNRYKLKILYSSVLAAFIISILTYNFS